MRAAGRGFRLLVLVGTALLVVGTVILVLHRCGGFLGCDHDGLPLGPVALPDVRAHPEAHLYYPGASVFTVLGGSEERAYVLFVAKRQAFAGTVLTSDDPPGAIYQWYRSWLLAHGWLPANNNPDRAQTSIQGYYRGHRESFHVAMDDPALLGQVLGRALPAGAKTVFEIEYSMQSAATAPDPQSAGN